MANKIINRFKAADLLNVSIRTIDRYMQNGTLKKKEINGRVFLHFEDLKPLMERKNLKDKYLAELEKITHINISKNQEPDKSHIYQVGESDTFTTSPVNTVKQHSRVEEGSEIYQKLYQELQEELKIKQERLEGANYRVGQLEGLLKESIPLIDYRKAIAEESHKRAELEDILKAFETDNDLLNQTIESKNTEVKQISQKLHIEKFNKKIFIILLIILFLLQPLWLLFPPSF